MGHMYHLNKGKEGKATYNKINDSRKKICALKLDMRYDSFVYDVCLGNLLPSVIGVQSSLAISPRGAFMTNDSLEKFSFCADKGVQENKQTTKTQNFSQRSILVFYFKNTVLTEGGSSGGSFDIAGSLWVTVGSRDVFLQAFSPI